MEGFVEPVTYANTHATTHMLFPKLSVELKIKHWFKLYSKLLCISVEFWKCPSSVDKLLWRCQASILPVLLLFFVDHHLVREAVSVPYCKVPANIQNAFESSVTVQLSLKNTRKYKLLYTFTVRNFGKENFSLGLYDQAYAKINYVCIQNWYIFPV